MGRVDGKIALVTGAASGIGLQASLRLAEEGARVMMTDINVENGKKEAEKLGRNAEFLKLDITLEEDWISVLRETVKRFQSLDILVNSAGMVLIADVEQISLEDWRHVHAVNLDGTFLGCKHGVRVMKEFGAGSIINLSSVSGLIGGFNLAAYNSSKGAVRMLTKSVALHCARSGYGIRCNSIHPTFIETPMLDSMIQDAPDPEKARQTLIRQVPLKRIGTTDDVAKMIVYLASDESTFVTGTEMVIDGGVVAQ
ncbi:MAG TPA: glucose 1-dehydrogenase [SAR324 cluster bacterium]|jgi:3(or 17)beta-hydroxysteroid dehydrogenase|nr:3-beta hydroxysteroid dehydrogenase [Deltaproteobacteria bacterium]MDP6093928.1 glucose 1-dehydrogenase [SAR324 cluster bacterium]MDP7335364.1 glucose 1-dehydrogenase [SAR324 cluster bacterium]MDP7497865.1 glucose 1-dehydrogenase [SAR324 cluster bacterium]HCP34289.1 3-beta hydroxysteroid dehydrogenase [Deltaproteobacteria bacterium]|tara:strand:- start:3941 stop:4702 length:762 start_codon:yes stop_codon:yes gene_type:complete